MPDERIHVANPAIREWLRSERRLGLGHWETSARIAPAAPERTASPEPAEAPTDDSGHLLGAASNERAGEGAGAVTDRGLDERAAREALSVLDEQSVKPCTRCDLHKTRTNTVFGVGRARPEIVFVGEGPGADEDRRGIPFVGRAGQLLTRMIAAMTLTREQVYICNVVKCRPPGNRTPTPEEMACCAPYLWQQLAVLRPRVIVALGRPAAQTLLATSAPIGRLRGQLYDFPPPEFAEHGIPRTKLMPTYHPAYLLRSPSEKAKAWADLQQVMQFLGIPLPKGPRD